VLSHTHRRLADIHRQARPAPQQASTAPDVTFGDFYVVWDPAGLHLAAIAMDYYDPDLLAYDGEFPLREAFRIDWGVDAGAGPQRFALYIILYGQKIGTCLVTGISARDTA
jgi:hypothetical protein